MNITTHISSYKCMSVEGGAETLVTFSYDRCVSISVGLEQGLRGADGAPGATYYTDTEISDDATAEFDYSYRVNSPDEVVLTIPEIDIEGKKIRVLQIGIGGCEIVFPDGVIVKLAGFSNQFIGGENAWKLRESDIAELWVTGGEKWLLLATGGYSKFDL